MVALLERLVYVSVVDYPFDLALCFVSAGSCSEWCCIVLCCGSEAVTEGGETQRGSNLVLLRKKRGERK